MELRVDELKLPVTPSFNYEELKASLTEKARVYELMIYDDDQIKQAKSDRADLNRLKKALNDERIRLEREYMAPFAAFKAQINEIIAIIDKPAGIIDQRVKEYEAHKAREKEKAIEELYEELDFPDYATLEKIWNIKWANASVSLKAIQAELESIREGIVADIDTLSQLPGFAFEAREFYKQTLDVNSAIREAARLTKIAEAKKAAEEEAARKAEEKAAEENAPEPAAVPEGDMAEEEERAAEPEAPAAQWIRFEAKLTASQAYGLKHFFEINNIEFRPI